MKHEAPRWFTLKGAVLTRYQPHAGRVYWEEIRLQVEIRASLL